MRSKFLFLLGIIVSIVGCHNSKVDNKMEYSLLRGVNYSKQNEYEKAMIEYQKAYSLDSNNVILLKELGYCYYQFGDYKRAEEFWLKGLEQAPKDDSIIKNLATLYYEEKDYPKALEIIKNSYNPNDDYYLKLRALILYESDKNQAYDLFSRINIKSFDKYTAIKYMELLKVLDKKEELYYFMKNSYPLFKDDKEYIINYTQNLVNIFYQDEEAKTILLEYIVRNKNDEDISLLLSKIYLKNGEMKKAKDVYKLLSN